MLMLRYFFQKRKLTRKLSDLFKVMQLTNRKSQHKTRACPSRGACRQPLRAARAGQKFVFGQCGLGNWNLNFSICRCVSERGVGKNASSGRQGSGYMHPWRSEFMMRLGYQEPFT